MSRIAILSDIHGNLPALESVLDDARRVGVDRFVCLGDTVGYGASSAECIDRIHGAGAQCVMGNHDVAIQRVREVGRGGMAAGWERSGYAAGLIHAAETLGDERSSWLAELPYTLKIPGALVAHANYHSPESFSYITDPESAAPTLGKLDRESGLTGFFGHTHIQEVFPDPVGGVEWLDGMRFQIPADAPCVVMVDSVGQPRHSSDLRAAWVLWDPEQRIVELRKTNYPRLQAARDIILAGLPLESAMKLLSYEEAAFL